MTVLKKNREFQSVYKKAKAGHTGSCVLFFLRGDEAKVGYTASKKVGNAVIRNRSKRRMRALVKEYETQIHLGTLIVVAKEAMTDTSYDTFKKDFYRSLKKTGALK